MNREDLLEAIGAADETMLEVSEKRTKRNWILSVAAAAICIAVLSGVIWQVMSEFSVTAQHVICDQAILWVNAPNLNAPDPSDDGNMGIGGVTADMQFLRSMSVHVRIKEILPDVYRHPFVEHDTDFYILRLRVLETIVGEGIPRDIYFALPAYLSTDLMEYDSFIMTIEQMGLEAYPMLNVTQKRMETFSLLFTTPTHDQVSIVGSDEKTALEKGAVLAFSGNQLDTSLWDKPGWGAYKTRVAQWLTDESVWAYPGKTGRNLPDTKAAIKELFSQHKYTPASRLDVIGEDHFAWEEAQAAIAYVKSQGQGAFSLYLSGDMHYYDTNGYFDNDMLIYCRIINGFATNERIVIQKETRPNDPAYQNVEYSDARFTEEDMEKLPDLLRGIAYIQTLQAEKWELEKISASYEKYENAVFGYIVAQWKDTTDNQDVKTYVLIFPDGTMLRAQSAEEMDQWIRQYPQ